MVGRHFGLFKKRCNQAIGNATVCGALAHRIDACICHSLQCVGDDKPLLWDAQKEGVQKLTKTIFFERSMPLFVFEFGSSDTGRDIGYELKKRVGPSVALAIPTFLLGIFVVVVFSLTLVFFRSTYLEFWGVAFAVFLLSISGLFYIIVGQFFFSKLLKLVPISGFAGGVDMFVFLALPVVIGIVSRLGGEALFYRTMFLEEIGKDYVRTARSKGLSETAVLFRHVLRNALLPILTSTVAVLPLLFLGALIMELILWVQMLCPVF